MSAIPREASKPPIMPTAEWRTPTALALHHGLAMPGASATRCFPAEGVPTC